MKNRRRAFYAVLDMGLGHASRSLPIIQHLMDQGWELYIGSSGRSLQFLKHELTKVNFVELPDYDLRYTTKGVSLWLMINQLPYLLKKIHRENEYTRQLVKEKLINMIISDHRYGCYHSDVPSFFLSHQIRFIAPKIFRLMEFSGLWFNQYFHNKYRAVIVPDEKQQKEGEFSGRLSRNSRTSGTHFCGILSSVKKEKVTEDIDVLVSISGPEPQRTVFERIIFSQVQDVPGKKVIVLGKPEDKRRETVSDGLSIYHFASRKVMQELLNRSKLIVSRSGYSTLMEMTELKKRALFVPTPRQTEQVYLAERMKKLGYFYFCPQNKLNLAEQIPIALSYDGVGSNYRTARTLLEIDKIVSDGLSK